ncbi:hypothetical protein GIB67_008886 [Kingdonia uniflora]|uniref:Uncharacterized protein n=1 Tax=Kingdonia uniflora TaxID=39325 RepID=A0A7J7LVP3_9MAGN|nr:hypothetical protein GIB67_008886 [Kingdonia uniflora]
MQLSRAKPPIILKNDDSPRSLYLRDEGEMDFEWKCIEIPTKTANKRSIEILGSYNGLLLLQERGRPKGSLKRTNLFLSCHTKHDGTLPEKIKDKMARINRLIENEPEIMEKDLDHDPIVLVVVYIEVDKFGEDLSKDPAKSLPSLLLTINSLFSKLEASVGELNTIHQSEYSGCAD